MKWLITAFLALTLLTGQALSQGMEGLDMGAMIKQMKLSKADMARMIDQLVQTGQIKPEDAAAAKKELMGMSDADLENVKMKAVDLYQKNGSDPSKLLDDKTLKALEALKQPSQESELTKKLRELEEGL